MTKPNKPSDVSGRVLWQKRIVAAGRWDEYCRLIREAKRENIIESPGERRLRVMRTMGYKDETTEGEIAHLARLESLAGEDEEKREIVRADERKQEQIQAFGDAVTGLPDRASTAKELLWVKNHPAMVRLARDRDKKDVLITAEDVLAPPHGPAPSKWAANQLQHWANRPNDFFKARLAEEKKVLEQGGEKLEVVEEQSIAEVKKLLQQVS